MKVIKAIVFAVIIPLGVFMFIYGGGDDSPGGQGLGLLMVVGGSWGLIRMKRKKSEVG